MTPQDDCAEERRGEPIAMTNRAPRAERHHAGAFGRTDAAWARSLARLAVRRAREGARALGSGRGVPPTRLLTPVRVGENVIRPLEAGDETSWIAAMRANESRMRAWWDIEGDWAVNTDSIAFAGHYTQWARRRRTGSGIAFALCTPAEGLVGELLVWNLDAGSGTAELGLWMTPHGLSARVMLPLLGGALDLLFEYCGVERLDAPVAVGNEPPRKVLAYSNFLNEGTLSQWRRLHGRMVDYDMYGLTRERWALGRVRLYRLNAWEPAINPPA